MAEMKFVDKMISMTASHAEHLVDLSRETGISQAGLVRQALDQFFEQKRQEKELLETIRAAEAVGAAEAARVALEVAKKKAAEAETAKAKPANKKAR